MKRFVFEILCVLSISSLLMACVGVKTTGGAGTRPGLIKIFNKGTDSLLCYAGPIHYKAVRSNDDFEIDHTYLKVKDRSNPVTCNFSLITNDSKFRPESVTLNLDGKIHNCGTPNRIFAEGYRKRDFIYRYSFTVSDTLFYHWMQCKEPVISINDKSFRGAGSYRKDANSIYRSFLFDLTVQ